MLARSLQDIDNDVDNQGTSSMSLLQALKHMHFYFDPDTLWEVIPSY